MIQPFFCFGPQRDEGLVVSLVKSELYSTDNAAQMNGPVIFVAMQYFEELSALLKKERLEDRSSYAKLMQTASIGERKANGVTWYPIIIKSSEPTRGDYTTVEVERGGNREQVHYFRFGSSVALFSNHDPNALRIEGIVTGVYEEGIKLTLYTEDLPDWIRDGKLGLDLLFDERSYQEMENAVEKASTAVMASKGSDLIKVLTGLKSPSFHNEDIAEPVIQLNSSQQLAVKKILTANELAIVHGPPGTGKTTTLVHAIKAEVRRLNERVLVVAPSNAAVDLLSEKLADQELNVVRIGNPERVSEKLVHLTLDDQISNHSRNKEIKQLKKQASAYKDMARKYKRNFGSAEREQRKALFNEAHLVMKEADSLEQFIAEDILSKADVLTATLVGCNHYTIRDIQFKTVFIDEAGQALEPASWIPILRAEKVVMAGDHFQLPPTIKSAAAAGEGLAVTLMEKNVKLHPDAVILLEEQYRMNEKIMRFSSGEFYEGRLKADQSVAHKVLFPGDDPLLFIDTAGCGFDEEQEGTSTFNREECAFLCKHLLTQIATLDEYYSKEQFPSIAVISPYQEQIRLLREQLKGYPEIAALGDRVAVNTIDSFQGQERDMVYISMARSNPRGEIGFLADVRRMNVAMTRAKQKLVIVGDSSTLGQANFYKDFIAYAESVNGYHSAWEFMND